MLEFILPFFTLSLLEILLGIDNIVILSIIVNRLTTKREQKIARRVGLALALLLRIGFLFALTWIMRMNDPLFSLFNHAFSIKDLILLTGGLFLIYRGVKEIDAMFKDAKYQNISKQAKDIYVTPSKKTKLSLVIAEIAFLDVMFAMDSMITAVALSDHLSVMIAANVFAILLMMAIVGWISVFLEKNPAFKVLAVCFLLLIGVSLLADGIGIHFPKEFLYFGIGFAFFIEAINTFLRKAEKS